MLLWAIATVLLGALAFWWGIRLGRLLVQRGATANDLFKGNASISLAFLGFYVLVLVLALHVPQLQGLPLELRVYGMRVTWTIMRILLLGICGVAFIISWKTARIQVIAVLLIGLLGLGSFTAAEAYFLAPISATLRDNLRPNGVFHQTSASSCAPAALATILRRWGLDATESNVARLAGTSRLGTSMPQLIVAVRELGMDGLELSPTWEQMQQINRPGVLATWLFSRRGRVAHATALLGLNDAIATIADPAFGRIYHVNRAQFDRVWRKQYVPIFYPTDTLLSASQVAEYLQKLGFLNEGLALMEGDHLTVSEADLTSAIQQFQQSMGINVTGKINPETALLLTGPFLQQGPTLNDSLPG